MENQRTETDQPRALSESLATVLASIIGMAAVACLLEPEEITKYTEGEIDYQELSARMLARIPNGGESSNVRLIRAFGIRIPPEVMDRFFQSLEMDGVPVDSWLADIENRITALEETISQPDEE